MKTAYKRIQFNMLLAGCLLIAISSPQADAQNLLKSLFGGKSGNAAIIRKARAHNLVPVSEAVPEARIDLIYKRTSAAKKPLYHPDMPALIHKSTGRKLRQVHQIVQKQGYGLLIWDAWRPPEAQQALWDAVRDPKFVVPPSRELSWHCLGISIDLTLTDQNGNPVKMPTGFDDFSDQAASNYKGGDPEVARNLKVLQDAMRSVGFRTIRSEWWHFDDMKAAGGVYKPTARDLGIRMP